MRVFLLAIVFLLMPQFAHAQYKTGAEHMSDLTINQTTDWVELVDGFRSYFSFDISSTTSSHCVCVMEADDLPSNTISCGGKRYCRKSGEVDWTGDEWSVAKRPWYGHLYIRAQDSGVVVLRVRY